MRLSLQREIEEGTNLLPNYHKVLMVSTIAEVTVFTSMDAFPLVLVETLLGAPGRSCGAQPQMKHSGGRWSIICLFHYPLFTDGNCIRRLSCSGILPNQNLALLCHE